MKVALLVSRYPLDTHVFILREVLALRRAGADIDTFTIRRAGAKHLLTGDEQHAAATTYAVLPPKAPLLARAHLAALLRHPRRYLSTARQALSLRRPGLRSALWQLFYFAEAVLVWSECRRRGIRHIHAHHANVASDVALLASHLGGSNWSWSLRMHGSAEFFDVWRHRLPDKVARARFVACVSDFGRSQLMTFAPPAQWDKLRVVRCGIDVRAFDPPAREGRQATEILTVGRVGPVKGQTLLVDAVAELSRRGLETHLNIVGDGPQLDELRSRVERLGLSALVSFPGRVGQDEIRTYYARADVFALPSFAEGLPVVLVEAMAMELPIVASRITGIPELVEDGVSGLLVTPGRGDELTEALERLLREPAERRQAMGRAGRETVLAGFDVRDSAAQLLQLFQELAG